MRESTLQIRCTLEEKEAWRQLAAAKNAKLSDYVRTLLNNMAGRNTNG